MNKKLLVAGLDYLPEWCREYIKSADITCSPNVSEENLSEKVKDCDGMLYMQTMSYPVTRTIIESGNKLKFVQSAGVGYELIDLAAATDNDVLVMNIPAATTVSVAEHTAALILACAKNLIQIHQSTATGEWRVGVLGIELRNKNLGIIGFGRIGQEVAKIMKGFEMNLLVYDPFVKEINIKKIGGKKVNIDILLKESDVITIHAPLMKETYGLINEEKLNLMKSTAILVNTARGELVDEEALYKALHDEKIRCAGLDVFRDEPVNKKNPLLSLENIVLSPHMAVQTSDGVLSLMRQNGEQVEKALHGIYENVVNPEVLEKIRGKKK
jgi:D-3-phosphoglycerate dehydrogenase / 2-oxoglutarate reductase